MRRSGLFVLVVIAGSIGAPAAQGSMGPWLFPPSLECLTSLNLTVEVEETAGLAGELVAANVLEQRILERATEILAKAGVASDPQASEIRLHVIPATGWINFAPVRDARWAESRAIKVGGEGEPATAREVEETALHMISEALGSSKNCRPTRVASADGRFELELPPDNPSARARYLEERLGTGATAETKSASWGFLIERPEKGPEEPRAVVRLPPDTDARQILVSNDGRFVVVLVPQTGTDWISIPIGASVRVVEIDLATGLPREAPGNLLPPPHAQSGV